MIIIMIELTSSHPDRLFQEIIIWDCAIRVPALTKNDYNTNKKKEEKRCCRSVVLLMIIFFFLEPSEQMPIVKKKKITSSLRYGRENRQHHFPSAEERGRRKEPQHPKKFGAKQ